MIAERIQQSNTSAKYYQFYTVATILEHVIDCFQTIVSDETNPYHPPLSWLSRKQPRSPKDELYLDLVKECSKPGLQANVSGSNDKQLSSSVRGRLEKCSSDLRKDIVSKTNEGCSPLFLACKNNHLNAVEYLLHFCGADIEQKGRYEASEDHHVHSVSPLWVAAVSGNIDIVRLLICNGANVNSLSDTGSTPLRSVCFLCRDDDNTVHQLEDEATFDDSFFQQEDSSKDIYMDIVKLLVDNGAEISRPNFNGGTCLINSIHNCQLTRYLIDNGAEVNASDNQSKTALHYAIQRGRLEVTKLLLSFGADPMLQTIFCDDALQLCCLGGHLDIFDHLITTINYPRRRLIEAYKLMGSSIVEIHYDLSTVRRLWHKSIALQFQSDSFKSYCKQDTNTEAKSAEAICDIRRSLAFGDIVEFKDELELQSLSTDDFRIQSLLISERILGAAHRETIQRLSKRGTFYIKSLRPDKCINLWIYALKLRLRHDSIFQSESIDAAQAITKLILDLASQQQQVQFRDVHDVLSILVKQLDKCQQHLTQKPVSCLHEDVFNLLLVLILNLLFVLNCVAKTSQESEAMHKLIRELIEIDPRTSNGSSLLHICIAPGILDGEAHKLVNSSRISSSSPLVELVKILIDDGLEVDSINHHSLSALQSLCLTSTRMSDKQSLIKVLVEGGAHVDRRSVSPEQGEMIRLALADAGINYFDHVTLRCLAARKVSETRNRFNEKLLTKRLRNLLEMH